MLNFKQINWKYEIVVPISKKSADYENEVVRYTMEWGLVKAVLFPMYKKSRSVLKRSNMLRILEYSFAKFIFYHENYYNRNPLGGDWNPINELNTKNIQPSSLPIEVMEELISVLSKSSK